jgi:hypothetical protein
MVVAAVVAGLVGLGAGFALGHQSGPTPGKAGPSGPGPWRVENGVPVGYAHTPEGAVAAATNFEGVKLGDLVLTPDRYRAAIQTMAAPSAQQKLSDEGEHWLVINASAITGHAQGKPVIQHDVPLAYHVDRYADTEAQVSIWGELISGVDGTLPLGEVWATDAYTLQWVAGDWRLGGVGGHDGPVPTTNQGAIQTKQMPPEVSNFKGYENASV